MRLTPGLSAGSRYGWIGFTLAIMASLLVGSAGAETPLAAATGQAPAQPAPGQLFNSGAGMILHYIKADKAADFEMVLGKMKEALQKSEDPIRKQQAASWKVYKVAEPGPEASVLYAFFVDPAVKDADYSVGKILSEGFPTEVQALYKTFTDCYASGRQIRFNLSPLLDMSK